MFRILSFSSTSIKLWRFGVFLADLLGNRSLLQRFQKVMVCDLWLVDFDPFCVFLCFKALCFWTSEFYLLSETCSTWKHALPETCSTCSTCFLKHGKFRFPTWNCSYRASKPRRNTDMGGWKRIGTLSPTLIFAASARNSARYCRLYLTRKDWMLW